MDMPVATSHELIRPWKRATLVASLVAALELVLLLGLGALLLAKPLSHTIRKHALAAATAPAPLTKTVTRALASAPATGAKPRSATHVMVLNGNGQAGAASMLAGRLQNLTYVVAGTGNAAHQNYASSVVMYRPGFRAAGLRLAKDLQIKVVGPLDGIGAAALHGGQVAVIIGA